MTAARSRVGRAARASAALLVACAVAAAAPGAGKAGAAPKGALGAVELHRLGSFEQPVGVAAAPSEPRDLYVVERAGRIAVIRDGKARAAPLLDISERVRSLDSEQGLLSIAFHPRFERNRLAYICFTQLDYDTQVAEIRLDRKGLRTVGEPRTVIVIPHRDDFPNHNAGQLQFGPDGLLYISVGDGAETELAQSPDSLRGKILRINPRPGGGEPYTAPGGNPYARRPGRDEIYAIGFRNPWRFSFDRRTGAIAIADVGSDAPVAREELNFRKRGKARGRNFGWPRFEGKDLINPGVAAPGALEPVFSYPHRGRCAITGGYVVRDPRLTVLVGRYLYADFCADHLRSLIPGQGRARDDRPLAAKPLRRVTSFGEDGSGRLLVATLDGPVYRLDPR